MNRFIVQEAIHADHVSQHDTAEEAEVAIDDLVRDGVVARGDLSIREIDSGGRTVRVFTPDVTPAVDRPSLTPRELEILRHVADGYSNEEIARMLVITPTTVNAHLRRILEKLGAATKGDAVESARRHSLVA